MSWATSLSRREILRTLGLGLAGYSASGWLPGLANALADDPKRQRHCILLWMTGGPTQTDTFDMKMKAPVEYRGQFREIETAAPGLRFCEHLPKLAKLAEHLAVIRSLSTKEGDHGRGTYLMRTGHQPGGPISFPTIGSSLSKALGREDFELPNYVSISPYEAFNRAAFSPGFLGPRHAPLTVGATDVFQPQPQQPAGGYAELGVDDLANASVGREQENARFELWNTLQTGFLKHHPSASPKAHHTVYERAVRMMRSEAAKAFDLSQEAAKVRDAYGRGRFGQGCLMARRLIERGVPFVEVSLGTFAGALGWDTHANNFPTVENLCGELDAGWASLVTDLNNRGLLESTTILWMGEFGRTPKVQPNRGEGGGRDHFPNAWSCVLAGGGIKGGQAFGRTSENGTAVEEGKVDVGDVLATLCKALGVNPATQNVSEIGRPIRIADGKPIRQVLA
jgi:hypothetical protein